jgi:hypothetical protein
MAIESRELVAIVLDPEFGMAENGLGRVSQV